MVFQDFDHLSERRRLERQRKFRKRVAIAAVSALVFIALIVGAVFALVASNNKTSRGKNSQVNNNASQSQEPQKQVSHVGKVIKMVCNATTYQETCQSTLDKAVQKNPSSAQPKALLKIAIQAADDEVEKVLNKISTFKFNTPQEKAAFEDCRELIENAKKELKDSISHAGNDLGQIAKNAPDLNNWLSAVMSYQETCIDGFPEGKLKSDMEMTFKTSKELTSNSLALVTALNSLLSSFPLAHRRLLAKESNSPSLDKDGLPPWISHEDRRMLKGANTDKPTPNVTVAKDGSGSFTTISAALAAMPANYQGRYAPLPHCLWDNYMNLIIHDPFFKKYFEISLPLMLGDFNCAVC